MSLLDIYRSPVADEFLVGPQRRAKLHHTLPVADVDATSFNALFILGGFGVMWDLVGDATVLANDRIGVDSLLRGRRAPAFSNAEEDAVSNGAVYPATVENALRSAGAVYTADEGIFGPSIVVDGTILPGQSSASSSALASALDEVLV